MEGRGTLADAENMLPPDALAGVRVIRVLNQAAEDADRDHERRGRPTKDTPARRAVILKRISRGDFLAVICREERLGDPDFPIPDSVDDWAKRDPEFKSDLARAREAGAFAYLQQAREIADTGFTDFISTPFGVQFNAASVARSKLQVETRIRLAEKLAPKLLGQRLALANDPEDPLHKPLSEYTEAELAAAYEKQRKANKGK